MAEPTVRSVEAQRVLVDHISLLFDAMKRDRATADHHRMRAEEFDRSASETDAVVTELLGVLKEMGGQVTRDDNGCIAFGTGPDVDDDSRRPTA